MSFTQIVFSKFTLSLAAVVFSVYILDRSFSVKVFKQSVTDLFTTKQLALFNGEDKKELYLAVLGVVYDVTKGRKHYGKGASYHYFVGKDASRSLISGVFSDSSSEQNDHVLDLTCDELFAVINWKEAFRKKYEHKGLLIGRYYDDSGIPTQYSQELRFRVHQCSLEKDAKEDKKQQYPPCNIEWSVGHGTKVWCSKNSGGVTRNWTGVPRQLYTPGEAKPECVCVDITKDHSDALLKEYSGCEPFSNTCIFQNDK